MIKILKYCFSDIIRSRWSYVYLLFYLLLGIVLLFLNNDLSKAVITLMNVIIILVPLISTVFGIMYYYNSREFTQLLLAQPVKRSSIFVGQYMGVALSLTMSLAVGLGIPFILYGVFKSPAIWDFVLLLVTGTFLTLIFTALSFNIGLANENKIKGFGYAILLWLFMAIIYDGLFLISLLVFQEYPLDTFSIAATLFNPIDLSRVLILLKLDISALMGYTGALFQKFFGAGLGILLSSITLLLWVLLPIAFMRRQAARKNF